MRLTISCELPTLLIAELEKAAHETATTPETFAAQTIEASLAARRLPNIPAARHGARIPSSWQPSTIPADDVPVAFNGPLSPAEVPTLSDLESVGDIT
jgi:hypothetical protein